MPEETEELAQQGLPEETAPQIPPIETPLGITLNGTINPADKIVDENVAYTGGNNNTTIGITVGLEQAAPKITSVSIGTSQTINLGQAGNLDLAANLAHTDEGNSEGITVGYTLQNGNLSIDGNGSVNFGGEESIQHNVDISASEVIAGVTTNVALHSDNQDSSITIGARKPLLNPDNINGHADDYQERKEELQESGDRWSVTSKVGYSQEKESVYTENSIMYRADDNNFVTANYNLSSCSEEVQVTGDLQGVRLNYTYNQTKSEDNEDTTHTLDTMVKDGKNQYTYTVETGKTVNPENDSINHSAIKTGIIINRTEYGEFQDGFNARLEGGLHATEGELDGCCGTLDIAYNKYGKDEHSNDFLIRGQLGYTHNTSLHEVSTSLDSAQRFNGCRTVFEESVGYSRTNNHSEAPFGILSVNAGVYQQVGKNFEDASIYTQLEYQHYTGGSHTNALRVYSGAKVKATDKLALNFENCYGTDKGWSGSMGFTYHF